ncbi:hypothetical protein FKP32DRAFT_222121 [Trametes sanguinea]|nr:hypothetical protein FKP32DRAFT_222121 [Trametes sanguinea]
MAQHSSQKRPFYFQLSSQHLSMGLVVTLNLFVTSIWSPPSRQCRSPSTVDLRLSSRGSPTVLRRVLSGLCRPVQCKPVLRARAPAALPAIVSGTPRSKEAKPADRAYNDSCALIFSTTTWCLNREACPTISEHRRTGKVRSLLVERPEFSGPGSAQGSICYASHIW